jgi:hypothetical protein
MRMITIKVDTGGAERWLSDLQKKRVPVATQRAMLATARSIRAAEIKEMNKVFDRPTKWTLGAMKVSPVESMSITVGILDPDGYYKRANNYLGTQVTGGDRRFKAMEVALQRVGVMPTGWYSVFGAKAKMDSFGNMGPGEIKQIMSWFNAAERWAGSTQNMTDATRAKRRKGTKKTRGYEYFFVKPGNKGLLPGVYRRTSFGFGKAVEPILIFVPRVSYQRRFNFEGVARRVYAEQFGPHFQYAFQRDVLGSAR